VSSYLNNLRKSSKTPNMTKKNQKFLKTPKISLFLENFITNPIIISPIGAK